MMSGAVVQGNFAGLLGYSHYAWTFHEDGTVDASYTLAASRAASRTASRTARTKTATDMGTWWVAGNNSLCVNFRKTFAGAPACFHVVAVSAKGVRRIRLTGAVEIEGTLQPAR
jgi:hypothetical protein